MTSSPQCPSPSRSPLKHKSETKTMKLRSRDQDRTQYYNTEICTYYPNLPFPHTHTPHKPITITRGACSSYQDSAVKLCLSRIFVKLSFQWFSDVWPPIIALSDQQSINQKLWYQNSLCWTVQYNCYIIYYRECIILWWWWPLISYYQLWLALLAIKGACSKIVGN